MTLDGSDSNRNRQVRQRARAGGFSTAARVAGGVAAALALSALVNHRLARRAEREHPPQGQFLTVNGVRLHYTERGSGKPLVLLHGNGSMIADFQSSGLLDLAAERYRVIVFDRPGYGHSDRHRGRVSTDQAQADLIAGALEQLGVTQAIVLGHSWGCSVAVALAHLHPRSVGGLVLASGYYYPTPRVDVALMSGLAVPVFGHVMRHSISPMLTRLIWPALLRKLFGPQEVPAKFNGFPKEMAVRPSQIRTSAVESALLIPDAVGLQKAYRTLQVPVAIIAGAADRLIDPQAQSARFHREVPHSRLYLIPAAGHMIHQTETDAVMAAINQVAELPEER